MGFMEKFCLWLEDDYFGQEAKDELRAIRGDIAEIEDRFHKNLEFGTGGLRGKIGAGTNRMNVYVIRHVTQGLANYLLKCPARKGEGVVIAYDTRHKSEEFAKEAALVLNGNGIKTYLFDGPRPTPELSYAVRELQAEAGIVITASHNPPDHNGYKVYWADGGQIVPELADQIAAEIGKIKNPCVVRKLDFQTAIDKGLYNRVGVDLDERYLREVKKVMLLPNLVREEGQLLKIMYTPLHGTGVSLLPPLLNDVGFRNFVLVKEQSDYNPNFPTVEVPNPEERNAFTLALKLAEQERPDIILATDPDADRVGVIAKKHDNHYTMLNGNQIGILLLHYILSKKSQLLEMPKNAVIIKTIVTSEMGRKIASHYGVKTLDTLTGFKYIGEKIKQFEETGEKKFIFGYEESNGYLAGTYTRDKDAISAALLICEMALYYKKQGLTLYEVLCGLYKKFGYYKETLVSRRLPDGKAGNDHIDAFMNGFRTTQPVSFGGISVVEVRDYLYPAGDSTDLRRSNVLHYRLEDDSWVCIRPSGTEPKIKCYISATADNQTEVDHKIESLRTEVQDMLARISAKKEPRKVLITGGAGFIGSHVVDQLVSAGDEVIVVDNLSAGKLKNVNSQARFYLIDITSHELDKVFELEKPEYVIHMAAQVSVNRSVKDPINDAKTNILGTLNVLELCRRYRIKKVVYVSSAAVYSKPSDCGVNEQYPVKPLSPYGVSKHTPEHYLNLYQTIYGLNFTVLRYSNVYGPRQESSGEGGVVVVFIQRLLNGKPPVVFGDGEQTRDFIYVKDVAEATVAALEKGDGHILNISTGEETSLNQLLSMMERIGGFDLQPTYSDERPGDLRRSVLDNGLAREVLSWRPSYSVEKGLKETIGYFLDVEAPSRQVASASERK